MPQPPYRSAAPLIAFPAVPPPRAQQALALQYQLQQSEWLPLEALRAQQMRQLALLAQHAFAHSPWWRRTLDQAGIGPATPWSMEVLRSLPTLTRTDLQDHGDAIACTSIPKEHGRVGVTRTSGSSGTPVAVRKTELSLLFWRAITLRDHLWHRRDLSTKSALIRYLPDDAEAASPTGRTASSWGPPTHDVFRTGPACLMSIQTPAAQQAAWLVAERPRYLLIYPSGLSDLLDLWEAEGTRPEGLVQVRTVSEAVPETLRQRCQDVLGATLVDCYSSQEVGYIALQCPDHPHYHLQSESCVTEILRDDGTPCGPGEIGKVVVTPLHNLAMPLFRYEIGDMAEVGAPCPCGRGLPVVTRIVGRIRGMLRHPDGSRSWPVFGGQHFRTVAPVRQWRVVQTAIDHVDVEIVPERPLTDTERQALAAHARKHAGWTHGLAIVERTEPIPRTKGGKYPDFVSAIREG